VSCYNPKQNDYKTLPCLHSYCNACYMKLGKGTDGDDGKATRLRCSAEGCGQTFLCLADPETGCKPLRTDEFTTDYLDDPVRLGVIKDSNYKVTVTLLFIAYFSILFCALLFGFMRSYTLCPNKRRPASAVLYFRDTRIPARELRTGIISGGVCLCVSVSLCICRHRISKTYHQKLI